MSCTSSAIDTVRASPSPPLRVGIVGLSAHGGWAATAHLPALASSPAWQVHALAASSPRSSEAAAAKYGIAHACRSVSELVERPDLDLVVVAVRVPQHKELVEAALGSGKAVLCEWPLAQNPAEAEQLTALAQRTGVPAFVGLQGRSLPAVRHLRDLVRNGGIGRVLSTTAIGSGGHRGAEIDPRVTYLLDRDNGATMMTIPFGHALDTVCHSLGEFTPSTPRRHHADPW
ncbi:Gfo/Idh/MocA family protein [Rhodococcus sp. P14]|uniref:Gfo/Idh/MocA family protein n=1 Tax=Rhodococcus sp. P14 TaxID=450821 RepID=UPI00307935C9